MRGIVKSGVYWEQKVRSGLFESRAMVTTSSQGRPQGSPPPHSTAPTMTMTTIPADGLSDFPEALVVRFVEARLIAHSNRTYCLILRCWRGGGSAVAFSGAG